jgi:isopentenyl-diphosphate Delta-isomerase
MDTVVLVDTKGEAIGTADKLEAHVAPGTLHRAFSVFLFRPDGTTLLQQRAATKYHFPLVWANACCSHPRPDEPPTDAAQRRMREELGIDCRPVSVGAFTYRATCPTSGLVEHEFDEVFVAEVGSDVIAQFDPDEVADAVWLAPEVVLVGGEGRELAPWCLEALKIAQAARSSRS